MSPHEDCCHRLWQVKIHRSQSQGKCMPFARAPNHPKEASRSGVGMGEAGGYISNVSHLCKQGSTHCCSICKRLKGCERLLETSELKRPAPAL